MGQVVLRGWKHEALVNRPYRKCLATRYYVDRIRRCIPAWNTWRHHARRLPVLYKRVFFDTLDELAKAREALGHYLPLTILFFLRFFWFWLAASQAPQPPRADGSS